MEKSVASTHHPLAEITETVDGIESELEVHLNPRESEITLSTPRGPPTGHRQDLETEIRQMKNTPPKYRLSIQNQELLDQKAANQQKYGKRASELNPQINISMKLDPVKPKKDTTQNSSSNNPQTTNTVTPTNTATGTVLNKGCDSIELTERTINDTEHKQRVNNAGETVSLPDVHQHDAVLDQKQGNFTNRKGGAKGGPMMKQSQ